MSESDCTCRQMMHRLSCMLGVRSCRVGGEAGRRMIGHPDCCMLRQHLGCMSLQSLLMDVDLFWLQCRRCCSRRRPCCRVYVVVRRLFKSMHLVWLRLFAGMELSQHEDASACGLRLPPLHPSFECRTRRFR